LKGPIGHSTTTAKEVYDLIKHRIKVHHRPSTCASAASASGRQKVISTDWDIAIAVVSAARAAMQRPLLAYSTGPEHLRHAHWRVYPFDRHRSERFDLHIAFRQAQHIGGDQDRVRHRHLFHARREMCGLAHRGIVHVEIAADGPLHYLNGRQQGGAGVLESEFDRTSLHGAPGVGPGHGVAAHHAIAPLGR
jgi:hypothetical protein